MTSVLVIDRHPIVLQGCRCVLEGAGIEAVLEASELVSGYRLYFRHHPDVVIVDFRMRGQERGGLSLIQRMRRHRPQTQILVFSMYDDPALVTSVLEAGALGYLIKDAATEELVEAVTQVRASKPYLSHQLAVTIAMLRRNAHLDPSADLTPRQIQTLTLLSRGKPYGLLARELGVGYKTIVNISHQLRLKLGVGTLPELIRKAVELLPRRPRSGGKQCR
jgi:two-component system, NarL family, invasion response regulator UvrY